MSGEGFYFHNCPGKKNSPIIELDPECFLCVPENLNTRHTLFRGDYMEAVVICVNLF